MPLRTVALVASIALGAFALKAADSPPNVGADPVNKIRLGVYDNRAIAVAYAPSKFNPVREKMQQLEQARDAGDTQRATQLEQWGQQHQRQLHRQGFCRVPVDDLLAHVQDRLPEVARSTRVSAITWQCDYSAPEVEVVDITDALVMLFEPSEKTLETVEQIKKHKPVDLDEIEKHHREQRKEP